MPPFGEVNSPLQVQTAPLHYICICISHPFLLFKTLLGKPRIEMRYAVCFLTVLMIAALLVPSAPWALLRANGDACMCPPAACHCATHNHGSASCCMGKGGLCGLNSPDNSLASTLSTLIYVPTEHPWADPLMPSAFEQGTSELNLLPSHVRIPEQPPRATL